MKTTSPAAASVSPLVNSDFEQWTDGKPVGWTIGRGRYQADPHMKVSGSSALRMNSERDQPEKWLSTRVEQRFTLEPNTDYKLSLWMAKDGEGKVLVRIRPVRNAKVVADGEVTLDWTNGWSRLFAWTPIHWSFRSGDDRQYELSIVQFGQPMEPVWIDRVMIQQQEEGRAGGIVGASGRDHRFQLFAPSMMVPFDRQSAPPADQLAPQELRFTAAQGEFACAVLGLRTLVAMENVDLRFSGALAGPDGAVLAAEAVDVRAIADQALLPPTRPRSAAASENLGWWITVKADERSAAGTYRGEAEILVSGTVAAKLPLVVEVLPFSLPRPDITFLVYHNERYFPAGPYLSAELREAYYRDMRNHGMNSVTVYNNPDADGSAEVDFDRDHAYQAGLLDIEALNKRGYKLTPEAVEERHEFGLNDILPMILRSGLGTEGHPVLWLPTKAGKYNWGGMPEQAMRATVQQWLSRQDWPAPLLYINDEPDGHPDRIAEARRVLDQVKSWNLPTRTVTANVAVEELGEDYDVWIQLDRRLTPEMAQAAREKTAELWVYDCNMPTDNAPFTRAMFGFWAYRAKVRGVALWAYYDAMNWYVDADGTVHGTNGQFALSRICPSPDGPVPTVSWETTRLGVDDYRYALLFDQLIRQAEEKSESLMDKVRSRLDASVIAQLEAWQKQLNRQQKPDEKSLEWKPADESQAEAQRQFVEADRLRREAAAARLVRKQVIESIPYDAVAVSSALPFMAANHTFYPTLGFGDPRTAAAEKRQTLVPYVLRLQNALAD